MESLKVKMETNEATTKMSSNEMQEVRRNSSEMRGQNISSDSQEVTGLDSFTSCSSRQSSSLAPSLYPDRSCGLVTVSQISSSGGQSAIPHCSFTSVSSTQISKEHSNESASNSLILSSSRQDLVSMLSDMNIPV